MTDDRNRLDVPHVTPNRAERRRFDPVDRPLPSLDDARAIALLARVHVRAIVRSRVVSAAVAELRRQAKAGESE